MRTLFAIIFTLLFVSPNLGFAQNPDYETRAYGKVILSDVNDFFQTGVDLIAQPFLWQRNDWLYFGGTFAATGALFLADEAVRDFAQRNQSGFADAVFSIDDYITGARSLIVPGAVYAVGFFSRNRSVRSLGLKSAEALIYSAAITQILKIAFGRYRPYNEEGNVTFEPFSFEESKYSLPSGHATAAFALASVFSSAFDNLAWEIFCYGTAGAISAARVYHDEHWLSDVFLGSVIGYSVGKFVLNEKGNHFFIGNVETRIYFTVSGIGLSAKF